MAMTIPLGVSLPDRGEGKFDARHAHLLAVDVQLVQAALRRGQRLAEQQFGEVFLDLV